MAAMLGSDLKSRMAREVRQLAQTPPEGVKYVETDADALTEVHADLTGPEGTPYSGAVFRLKLVSISATVEFCVYLSWLFS